MKSADIRRTFLEFFQEHGHEIVPSSPLVPGNDPTLLFTNAGMVQFKDVFTGREQRSYHRAVTSQRCVRAGGAARRMQGVSARRLLVRARWRAGCVCAAAAWWLGVRVV